MMVVRHGAVDWGRWQVVSQPACNGNVGLCTSVLLGVIKYRFTTHLFLMVCIEMENDLGAFSKIFNKK